MSSPIHPIPSRQAKAFGLALCERLGLDPDVVGEKLDWTVNSEGDLAEIRFTAYLPAQDVIDMFNAAGKA